MPTSNPPPHQVLAGDALHTGALPGSGKSHAAVHDPAAPSSAMAATDIPTALADLLHNATGAEPWARAQLAGTGAIADLEQRLAVRLDRRHVLALSSATTGLIAAALALDLGGKEVITTPLSYGATLTGLLLAGARPVFVDVDPATLTLNPDAVRRALTPRTRAILAVDFLGVPVDDAALRAVADTHGLILMVDAAQSLGAARTGRPAGRYAHLTIHSFTVEKTISAGEGGALATDDQNLFEAAVAWTQHPSRQAREFGFAGRSEVTLNGRMHPLAALWLNAAWDTAWARLEVQQRQALALITALNGTGLTEPLPFSWESVRPSGYCVAAAWHGRPEPERLHATLASASHSVSLGTRSLALLPDQPSVRASFGRRMRVADPLTVAKDQATRRFVLLPVGDPVT